MEDVKKIDTRFAAQLIAAARKLEATGLEPEDPKLRAGVRLLLMSRGVGARHHFNVLDMVETLIGDDDGKGLRTTLAVGAMSYRKVSDFETEHLD